MRSIKKIYTLLFFAFLGFSGTSVLAVTLPEAPSGLKAEYKNDGRFNFSWLASSSISTSGYSLYCRRIWNGGKSIFVRCNNEPIHGTKYSMPYSDVPSIIQFVVRALTEARPPLESKNSNIVEVSIDKDFRVFEKTPIKTNGPGFIDLAKEVGMNKFPTPKDNNIKGFNIYMSDDNVTFGLLNSQPVGNEESYLVNNLEIGKHYYFAFTTVALDNIESNKSHILSVAARARLPSK